MIKVEDLGMAILCLCFLKSVGYLVVVWVQKVKYNSSYLVFRCFMIEKSSEMIHF